LRRGGPITLPSFAFLYDEALPNRYAATKQILCTGAALAEAGAKFTLHGGTLSEDGARILARYGLSPSPHLHLASTFPTAARPGLWRRLLTFRALRPILAGGGPDVVMTRGETGLAALPLLRRLRGERAGPLLLYELHRLAYLKAAEAAAGRTVPSDAALPPEIQRLKAAEARAITAADGLVCLTEGVAAAVREAFGADKPCLVLPSGTDLPPPPTADRTLDVVYAGKIEARKGLGELVTAMAALPALTAHIAGGTPEEVARLRAQAQAEGARLETLGWIEPAAVSDLFARARVGVCPLPVGVSSVSERFTSPMKLIEMMAHGVAVVATDVPAVRAIATDGQDAVLVQPNDPSGLSNAIGALVSDASARARLGAAARRRAEDFSWHNRARRLAAFASELIADRSAPGV
jgi:glycosyltransferase involved in cell wall biosynthesis